MRRSLSALLFALSLVGTEGARAADERAEIELPPDLESFDDRHRPEASPWRQRPFAVEGQLGLGAPLGMAGIAFDVSPSPGFGLNAGAGIGHATRAPQLALGARTRIIVSHGFAVGAEGGVSLGRYEEHIECPGGGCPPEWHFNRAVWGNLGLMLEHRSDDGLALRWSFGATGIFNITSAECVRCDATDEPSMWNSTVPYTLLGVGWAFPR